MFTRIHHVAIAVRSLGEARRFYQDALGLTVAREATLAEQGVRAALLPVGADEIELLEPVDPAGGVARYLERRGEGLHHMCLETPDILAAVAAAKAAGLPLIDQTPHAGLAGHIAFLHPKASAGVLIEMAQPDGEATSGRSDVAGGPLLGFAAVYIAVRDLAGAAATFVRNFGGRVAASADERQFEGGALTVKIGASRVTLLSPGAAAEGATPVARFLADRGEGIFGIGFRVLDLPRACRQLGDRGVSVRLNEETGVTAPAGIDPLLAHGVTLVLSGPNGA